ncbi:hypothetical protein EDF68_1238 [Ochrobactrum sp. BH3]|nr:hypothetical protein EDF68_1238 [Ochrobactrum sp. BH3]
MHLRRWAVPLSMDWFPTNRGRIVLSACPLHSPSAASPCWGQTALHRRVLGEPSIGTATHRPRGISGWLWLKIERGLHFKSKKTLSAYASESATLSRINA